MHRVLVRRFDDRRVWLDPEEVHHLVQVARVRENAEFEALTGTGKKFICTLQREGTTWSGRILSEYVETWESPLKLTLAQALVKKDRFEWIVQKAVELGVNEILPIVTYRTEIRLDDANQDRKLVRWQKILDEAVKQCGRTVVPVLHEPVPLREALELQKGAFQIVLDEAGGGDLRNLLRSYVGTGPVVVYIGPEGGWDDRDRLLFTAGQVERVRLGDRVMRTETAAVAAVAILQYEKGDLSTAVSSEFDSGRSDP